MTEQNSNNNNATPDPNATPAATPSVEELMARLEKAEKLTKDAQKRAEGDKAKRLELEQKQAEAEEARRKASLEAEGNYKQALEEEKAKYKAEIERRDRELLRRDFKDRLRKSAPSGNDVFFDWAADRLPADFDMDKIEEHIAGLKETESLAAYFAEPTTPVIPPTQQKGTPGVQPGGGSSLSLDARLKSDDAKVKLDALNEQLRGQLSGQLPIAPVAAKK